MLWDQTQYSRPRQSAWAGNWLRPARPAALMSAALTMALVVLVLLGTRVTCEA